MTRDEILQVKPGPEFNTLVAELMGWNVHPITIAAVWEVVEKLKKRYLVNIVVDGASEYAQFVEFRDDDVLTYIAENGTMPENIAKAALLAVSAERSDY